jgi:hypothetical protein
MVGVQGLGEAMSIYENILDFVFCWTPVQGNLLQVAKLGIQREAAGGPMEAWALRSEDLSGKRRKISFALVWQKADFIRGGKGSCLADSKIDPLFDREAVMKVAQFVSKSEFLAELERQS